MMASVALQTQRPKVSGAGRRLSARAGADNSVIRREAMERVWDAWKLLKSMADADKKQSIKVILDRSASNQEFRKLLENEAAQLNTIENCHLVDADCYSPESP